MTTVLLTGATGFVGRQVLRSLQKKDANIILVSRPGWRKKIKNVDKVLHVIESNDLFSESVVWWKNTCKGVDVIVHVAWYAKHGKYLSSEKNIDCMVGTLNIAKGSILAKVKKFVGIGTCFEYGISEKKITVDYKIEPRTLYAASKASTYFNLLQLLPVNNIKFTWCRLFYMYGENEDNNRLVPYIKNKLDNDEIVELTSGNQVRDFMDVRDVGKEIVCAVFSNSNKVLNICSGEPITVRELATNIADEYGKRNLLRFGVKQNNIFDPLYVVGVKSEVNC